MNDYFQLTPSQLDWVNGMKCSLLIKDTVLYFLAKQHPFQVIQNLRRADFIYDRETGKVMPLDIVIVAKQDPSIPKQPRRRWSQP